MKPTARDIRIDQQQQHTGRLTAAIASPELPPLPQPRSLQQTDAPLFGDQEVPTSHLGNVFGTSSPNMIFCASPPFTGQSTPRLNPVATDNQQNLPGFALESRSRMQTPEVKPAAQHSASIQALLCDNNSPGGDENRFPFPVTMGYGLLGDRETAGIMDIRSMVDGSKSFHSVASLLDQDEPPRLTANPRDTLIAPVTPVTTPYVPNYEDSDTSPDYHRGVYRCDFPTCDRVFDRYHNLRSHIKTHSSDKPYTCRTCGMCFSRNHDLKRCVYYQISNE
jgi:hypothetical protein